MKNLRQKKVSIDWKKISSIDVYNFGDQIMRNHSLLNETSISIAFCSLSDEFDTSSIDKNVVKLLRISQIIIEYLLNQYNALKGEDSEQKCHQNLVQENKKLRKLLEIHQKAMTYNGVLNNDYMQCPHCPKAFYDVTFLKTHIARRHPNESLDSEGVMSLTRKIQDYQSFLIGDNKVMDEMRAEMHSMAEKLGKTELDLLLEKEARMKLEEKFESEVMVKVREMHNHFNEQIRDFKEQSMTSLRANISAENSDQIEDQRDGDSGFQSTTEASNVWQNKWQSIIATQAKEMIKLGNNVERLVLHLTDTKSRNQREENNLHSNQSKQQISKLSTIKTKPNERINSESKISDKEDNRENGGQNKLKTEISDSSRKPNISTQEIRADIENSIKEKLISFGIDSEATGIDGHSYASALEKLTKEKNLLIEQNRHDYDFKSIEKEIEKIVEKKLVDRSLKDTEAVKPQAKERKSKTLSDETQSFPIEAIVHVKPMPTTDRSVGQTDNSVVNTSPDKSNQFRPKSSLASGSARVKSIDDSDRVERHIRFSDYHIEHEISADESSETSEELVAFDSNYFRGQTSASEPKSEIPIPAQRINVRVGDQSNALPVISGEGIDDNDGESDDSDSDDEIMSDMLRPKTSRRSEDRNRHSLELDENSKSSSQTKVQELAEMIESQLTKRQISNKKPPIGSVNVMSANQQKSTNEVRDDPYFDY